MRELQRKAQVFILIVWLGGLLSALAVIFTSIPRGRVTLWELGLFSVLALMAGGKKIRLMRHKSADDVGSMSLGFVITFTAMLRFGPAAALLVDSITTLGSCLYPKRQPNLQLLFNVALSGIESWLSSLAFIWLNGHTLVLTAPDSFPAVMVSCLSYFLINTGCVATIIALCTEQSVFRLWRETFLWTAPSYFAGGCISAVSLILFGRNVETFLLFVTPVVYLTYQSYVVYTSRAEEKQLHIEELQVSQTHLAELYLATIKSLALAIDAKDQYTHQHILRVQRYAVGIAKHMGVSGTELEGINTGALLHDIGKLGVPEYVLLKPGRLNDEEYAKVKKHPEIGAAILDPVEFPWPVLPAVKYHHERWDGKGYPEGLKDKNIPLGARILAVADVYDALTSNRSYRVAMSHEDALEVLKRGSASQFDPDAVNVFLKVADGIIKEMAEEGYGPLVLKNTRKQTVSCKADEAVQDIQRSSSELWALYEVAQTLSSSLGLHETLDILGRKLEAIMPGTACVFLLKEEGTEMLVANTAVGVNKSYFKQCHTIGPASRSVRASVERATYLGTYDPDDLMINGSPEQQWEPLQSTLIVPIVHQGEGLGTINLYHTVANAFADYDRQLMEAIAERAAMALYNGLLYDRTRSQANTDTLTGLFNLRYVTQFLEKRCADAQALVKAENREQAPSGSDGAAPRFQLRKEDSFALLCLDLDSFKPINDNFGHQKGDQVLRDLATIFRETVREKDVVARNGGDEFLIVLNASEADDAVRMTHRLQQAVESYDPGLKHQRLGSIKLGVSVGWACFPTDATDYPTLISHADARMYGDKTERKLGRLASGSHREPNIKRDENGEDISDAA